MHRVSGTRLLVELFGRLSARRRKGKGRGRSASRRLSLKAGFLLCGVLAVFGLISEWFVHHPRQWLIDQSEALPSFVTSPLFRLGDRLADVTDAMGWTGHDAVYEYDTEPPSGEILFAGAPVRVNGPAPSDIRILKRGEFLIGWSDRLRHPVWCAYHIVRDARHGSGTRPGFTKDHAVPRSPAPADYARSGYDRGHMVPNYAIATRYGDAERRKTFMMSNIAPQSPELNRGVWCNLEKRIADLWTARYGEIWVIVGCISSGGETIPGTEIDVPSEFYQLVIAQEGMDVRAMATLFSQRVPWNESAARNLVTIDELEKRTGLDFNPELPAFIQDPLEADLPSRLWPIRLADLPRLVSFWFQ